MGEMVTVEIDTKVEVYPELVIREDEDERSNIRVPAEMLDRLGDAHAAVEQAELEIMRYVAERYPHVEAVSKWVAERTTDG